VIEPLLETAKGNFFDRVGTIHSLKTFVHVRSIKKRGKFKMQSERINLAANELTQRVRGHFKLDLQREMFDAAVESFEHDDSPLKLKNFASALRKLGGIWLEQLAPKDRIRACEWFEQNTHLRKEDFVTRAQRAKYAVQGELHDDVLEYLHIDVRSTVKEYLALIGELSKYGLTIEEHSDTPAETAELEAIRALETFDQLSELIQERHASLLSSAAVAALDAASLDCEVYDEVDGALFVEVGEELDRPSTHVTSDDLKLDSLSILSLAPDRIVYQGRGRVYARLQYGPISVVALDIDEPVHDIYPFECNFESCTGYLYPTFIRGSMKIDTGQG